MSMGMPILQLACTFIINIHNFRVAYKLKMYFPFHYVYLLHYIYIFTCTVRLSKRNFLTVFHTMCTVSTIYIYYLQLHAHNYSSVA